MRTLGLRTKLVLTFTGLFLAFTLVFAWYLIERRRFSTSARGRVFRSSFVWDFDPGFASGPSDGGPSDFALDMSHSLVWHTPDDSDATSSGGHSPRGGTSAVHQSATSWPKSGEYVMSLVYVIISV